MTSAKDRVTLIAFCLVPFVVLIGKIIHEGHRASMFLAGVFILGAFVKNPWLRSFVWFWATWILALMLATVLKLMPPEFGQNANSLTPIMTSALMFYLAMQESKIKIDTVYNVICVTAIIQSLLAVMQMWGVDPFHSFICLYVNAVKKLDVTTTVGSLGNNNFLAIYLAICLPFFYRKKWNLYLPVIISVILVSITSTAVVAAMIGALIYFRDRVKWRWIALAAIPLIVYLCMIKASLTWNFTFDHDRFHWWRSAVFFWKQTWGGMIFGFGPGASWGRNFPIHNEWITALFNFGIIGLGLAIGGFLTLYRKNRVLYAAIITACVTFNGTYPLHLAPSTMLVMIVLGLMERERHCQLNPTP